MQIYTGFFLQHEEGNNQSTDLEDMKVITKDIGYDLSLPDNTHLTSLFFLALDCGFLATLTNDKHSEHEFEKYNTSILSFLQSHSFHYFLSGIYLGLF